MPPADDLAILLLPLLVVGVVMGTVVLLMRRAQARGRPWTRGVALAHVAVGVAVLVIALEVASRTRPGR